MLAFWSLMIFFVSFSGCFWSNFCEGYYNAKDHPDVKNKRRSDSYYPSWITGPNSYFSGASSIMQYLILKNDDENC